jgi:uncharacterized lipoprotein YajG
MLRLPSKRASLLILAFPVLILAGCSDSLTSVERSPESFANSNKSMGKTLNAAQQKAAIADLQKETAKGESTSEAETTASVKPAEPSN